MRRDGAFGGSRMEIRGDSATTQDEDATEVRKRSCPRHCDEPTPSQRQAGNSSVCGSS